MLGIDIKTGRAVMVYPTNPRATPGPSPPSGPLFSPADRNPLVWMDPSQGVTTNVGSEITQWNDQGTEGLIFTQDTIGVTPAPLPTFVTSDPSFGGKPTALFTPPNASLRANMTSSTPVSIYVAALAQNLDLRTIVSLFTGRSINFGYAPYGWYMAHGLPITSGNTTLGPHVLCAVFNGVNSALYIDSSEAPAATGNPGTGVSGPSNLEAYLGSGSPTGTNTIRIGMVIVVNGVDTQAQIAKMFAFFGAYYGKPWS